MKKSNPSQLIQSLLDEIQQQETQITATSMIPSETMYYMGDDHVTIYKKIPNHDRDEAVKKDINLKRARKSYDDDDDKIRVVVGRDTILQHPNNKNQLNSNCGNRNDTNSNKHGRRQAAKTETGHRSRGGIDRKNACRFGRRNWCRRDAPSPTAVF